MLLGDFLPGGVVCVLWLCELYLLVYLICLFGCAGLCLLLRRLFVRWWLFAMLDFVKYLF